jgi:UDP-2,4-diacetamido-2,4,6-trideoxy-beta-L-altropyranose hydrolase
MRFLFRTDADAQIGTGHLMRCLALARALRATGAECMFLCRSAGLGSLAERIVAEGHTLLALPEVNSTHVDVGESAHAHWLPGGWRRDAEACHHALSGMPTSDWLIVDHYALDHHWQSSMRVAAHKLMVIDDLADRQHDCDLLLDQNLVEAMEPRYVGLVPNHCVRLLGPRYALLRQEFEQNESHPNPSLSRAEQPRLLIMFGGTDAGNLTLRTLQALIRLRWIGPVDVVAGPLYAYLPELRAAMAGLPAALLHASADNIAELMRQAGIAVGSPGVASWERCACSLPTLAIAQADNQEMIGAALAEAGAHWYIGRAESVSDGVLDASLRMLLGNPWGCESLRRNARRICDGRGVSRVSAVLGSVGEVEIRLACAEDGDMLFSWRNDERTRRYFHNPAPLAFAEHIKWFERILADKTKILLVSSRGGVPVGCVRFDLHDNVADVSIYLDPSLQGHGVGGRVLCAAMDWLYEQHPEITTIDAEVHSGNVASAKMFLRCGYRPTWSRFEHRGVTA